MGGKICSILVSILFFETKPRIQEQTPTKDGTGVLPGVPLACLKPTIVMDKSPRQPGPLLTIHALGLPQEVLCPLGNPDDCSLRLAHSGFPLGFLSRGQASPGCNIGPSTRSSSLTWVSPSCIRWQTSWFQS